MKIYTVHVNPSDPKLIENAIFVKEGFSFFAAMLHVFWALFHKMWLVSAIILAVEIFLTALQSSEFVAVGIIESIKLGLLLFIGFNFNDWYRFYLNKRGYVLQDIISASNEDDARYKFMSDMLQRSTFGSSQGLPKLV